MCDWVGDSVHLCVWEADNSYFCVLEECEVRLWAWAEGSARLYTWEAHNVHLCVSEVHSAHSCASEAHSILPCALGENGTPLYARVKDNVQSSCVSVGGNAQLVYALVEACTSRMYVWGQDNEAFRSLTSVEGNVSRRYN